MIASIIEIGEEQGVCIPEDIIEKCGFTSEVEFIVNSNELIIKPHKLARENWEKAFKTMQKKMMIYY